ncbi:MAG: helix-turn-helix domain-containing protein [Bacteroidota bacterium]
MDLKLINLIGKMSDDVEKLKEMVKDLTIQVAALKTEKREALPQTENSNHSLTEFITVNDIMKILKLSRNSVLGLIKSGFIREIRFTSRTIRYNKNEVLALAQPKS